MSDSSLYDFIKVVTKLNRDTRFRIDWENPSKIHKLPKDLDLLGSGPVRVDFWIYYKDTKNLKMPRLESDRKIKKIWLKREICTGLDIDIEYFDDCK